ncbi:unnamed protein product, partial [Ectocarpus sp. 4 AP-2014]
IYTLRSSAKRFYYSQGLASGGRCAVEYYYRLLRGLRESPWLCCIVASSPARKLKCHSSPAAGVSINSGVD